MSEKQYITKMITIENTSDAAINNFIADKDIEERKKVISDINSHIYIAAMDGEFKVLQKLR